MTPKNEVPIRITARIVDATGATIGYQADIPTRVLIDIAPSYSVVTHIDGHSDAPVTVVGSPACLRSWADDTTGNNMTALPTQHNE